MKIIKRSKKKIFFFTVIVFLLLCFVPVGFSLGDISNSDLWKRISMDFKDASLKDVLKIFSQQSGLNFVAAENIEDINLTLYLNDVSVKQALEKLLSANSLIYELDPASNIFMVKRSTAPEIKLLTKVFYLKFARVPGSRLGGEITSGMSVSLKGLSGGGDGGVAEEGASSIVTIITNILTEFGKIDVDVRTNSLIVTDIPQQFAVIEDVIAKLDTPLPQVMIEVEILDVAKNDVDDLGVQWPTSVAKLDVSGAKAVSFPFNPSRYKARTSGASWSEYTSPGGVDLSGWSSYNFLPSILSVVNAELALNLLKSKTSTKSLARPRILTLSNETAEIKIVTDEAIGIETSSSTNSEGGAVTSVSAERYETGVSLRVTPQVDMDSREITMFIEPVVSEAKTGGTFTSGGQSSDFKDPEIRGTKSTVRMKDGNTLLIGGLIKDDDEDTRTNVAFFSKIPILGMLFRHKSKTKKERELVIFITPHIIDGRSAGMAQAADFSQLSFDLDREQALSGRERRVEQLLKEYDIR